MKITSIFLLSWVVLYFSCKSGDAAKTITLHHYKETPAFIKSFLDSTNYGKFSIAEPGQKWRSGCVILEDIPSTQFVSASLSKSQYEMVYWSGGFAGPHKSTITLGLKGNKVVSYACGNLPLKQTGN